ncbi:uncharacterized protein LOC112524815 [Cynara cardunculus var. scolymus]|uniref:DUF7733 domain-containing protein n=1 Tax=Cynara cardunculus var. scolymus TaxID=59895 RepID=A0A103Y8Z1_CYNCS|nr:uncharacterized protein LOC112524815 [Cynara cardunculus var. scolymus]KVI04716.1 hypothetical protein Ccrd_016960 [Cynara cardunculus var. scolymus]
MSGGVAPIALTNEKPSIGRRRGFFSFQQLNALALIIVLSASGMVAFQDFAFVLLSFFYMFFMSKVAFPTRSSTPEPPVFGNSSRLLTVYVSVGAVIGLLLPVAYIVHGVLAGDKEGIKAAAPHVFLLASQVFMEGVTFSGGFSLPIRVFVPVVYNSMRMYAILEWVKDEITKANKEHHGSSRRLQVGRSLAMANMVFWSFNLFGFLLPFYLPKAFKKYYAAGKDS